MIMYFLYNKFLSKLLEPVEYDDAALFFHDTNLNNRFIKVVACLFFTFEIILYIFFFGEIMGFLFFSNVK